MTGSVPSASPGSKIDRMAATGRRSGLCERRPLPYRPGMGLEATNRAGAAGRGRARRAVGRRSAAVAVVLAGSVGRCDVAVAQADENGIGPNSIATSLPENGDPAGLRKWLAGRGVTFTSIYTSEVLGNVSGGLKRGAAYGGKFEFNTTVDLDRMAGLDGLTFYANAFQIHESAGISRRFVGNFQTISAIEALPSTRLSELWLERKFADGTFGIRVGQLAADSEFFIAGYSLPFIDSDWPAITKQNLPSGGPAYPLAAPGIRVRWDPTPRWSVLAAIFDGDPAGRGTREAEVRNRTGTRFPLSDPAFLMQEAQYRYNQEPDGEGLAGIVRLGAWEHLARFDAQRFRSGDGELPGSPAGQRRLAGNGGVYGIIDQQLYRPPGGNPNSGVTAFSRISASPSDRNPVGFYLDGGLLFTGLLPGRPADQVGATFLWSEISSDARSFDRRRAALAGRNLPVRDREIAFELSYVAQVRPGWTVQPDFQYIFQPGGHVSRSDSDPTVAIRDAVVVGLRTTIIY